MLLSRGEVAIGGDWSSHADRLLSSRVRRIANAMGGLTCSKLANLAGALAAQGKIKGESKTAAIVVIRISEPDVKQFAVCKLGRVGAVVVVVWDQDRVWRTKGLHRALCMHDGQRFSVDDENGWVGEGFTRNEDQD